MANKIDKEKLRDLLDQNISISIPMLTQERRETILQLGPGAPQVVAPEGTKRSEKTLPAVGTPGGVT